MERTGFNYGDSWMMTWGDDGKTYTNFSDGKLEPGKYKPTNAILEIADDPPDLRPESFVAISADPLERKSSWSHYIISTIFVDSVLYVGPRQPRGSAPRWPRASPALTIAARP